MDNYEVYRIVYMLAITRLNSNLPLDKYRKAIHVLRRHKWSDEQYDNKTDVGA